ncbi:MAG TPA: hypothetical protein VEF06_11805 [Bryobacteraceae bacterium]|nr:hypothetical protein [Bryobacteraceae bacterium]
MKLPNGSRAIVDIAKIRDYCLNPLHPRGRHKARVFAAALGLTRADAVLLRAHLLHAAAGAEATPGAMDEFGVRYTIDSVLEYNGFSSPIRSAWLIPAGDKTPRLTTCFVIMK